MKLIVTVDTEADNQWKQDGTQTLYNLDHLPRFQEFMEAHNVAPIYFASYEVLEHPYITSLITEKHHSGLAELGGHLHPWTTPPYDELDTEVQRFPNELPDDVLNAKLTQLTEKLKMCLGENPISFRAGRWGFDARVARALVQHGYRVDSSVTPGIDWCITVRDRAKHTRIPNFSHDSIHIATVEGLREVPMTVLPTGFFRSEQLARFAWQQNLVGKVVRFLTRPKWCRIFPETTLADLTAVYQAARNEGLDTLVFMTHSSELAPGMSPYAKDEAAVERIYALLDSFITMLTTEGATPARLRDIQ